MLTQSEKFAFNFLCPIESSNDDNDDDTDDTDDTDADDVDDADDDFGSKYFSVLYCFAPGNERTLLNCCTNIDFALLPPRHLQRRR